MAFDNVQPKRPKPPLRTKRSPQKVPSVDQTDDQMSEKPNNKHEQISHHDSDLIAEKKGNFCILENS